MSLLSSLVTDKSVVLGRPRNRLAKAGDDTDFLLLASAVHSFFDTPPSFVLGPKVNCKDENQSSGRRSKVTRQVTLDPKGKGKGKGKGKEGQGISAGAATEGNLARLGALVVSAERSRSYHRWSRFRDAAEPDVCRRLDFGRRKRASKDLHF